MHRALISVAFSSASAVIRVAGQLAIVPLYIAEWGLAGYGEWIIYFGFMPLVLMLDAGLTGILGNRINQKYVSEQGGINTLIAAMILSGLYITIGIGLSITVYILAENGEGQYGILSDLNVGIVATFVTVAVTKIMTAQLLALNFSKEKYHINNGVHFSIAFAELLGTVMLLVVYSVDQSDIAYFYMTVNVLSLAVVFVKIGRPALKNVSCKCEEILKEAVFLAPKSASMFAFFFGNFVNGYGFYYVAGLSLNSTTVGALAAFRTYGKTIEQAPNVLYSTFFAEMVYASNRKEELQLRGLYERFTRICLISSLSIALIILVTYHVIVQYIAPSSAVLVGYDTAVIITISYVYRSITLSTIAVLSGTLRHNKFAMRALVINAFTVAVCVSNADGLNADALAAAFLMADFSVFLVGQYYVSRSLGFTSLSVWMNIFSLKAVHQELLAIKDVIARR